MNKGKEGHKDKSALLMRIGKKEHKDERTLRIRARKGAGTSAHGPSESLVFL